MPQVRPGPARVHTLLLVLSLLAIVTTGCSQDDTPTAADPRPTMIEVSIANGTVTPDGEAVTVSTGQPVALVIKADDEGEVHVHAPDSRDEHVYRYQPGTTTCMFTIDTAGVVDVELHGAERLLLARLEVR